jgi:hypothetical protein
MTHPGSRSLTGRSLCSRSPAAPQLSGTHGELATRPNYLHLCEAMTEESTDEKFEQLMRLAQFRLDRWTNRREHEWKISVTIWTLLAAVLAALVSRKLQPTSPISVYLSAPSAIVAIAVHSIWVGANWNRNMSDIREAFKYTEEAHLLATERPLPKPPDAAKCFICDPICFVPIGITVILALGIVLVAASQ